VKSDVPYLAHIADAITAIESYTSGGRDKFMAEQLLQDAVIRNFEVIGEAANRLSADLRNRSGFPWSKVIAFRNRLIHGYWSVDLPLVWDVIEHELPDLKAEVQRLQAEISGSGSSQK
jgi:uncharacterized protein with HEPN domain